MPEQDFRDAIVKDVRVTRGDPLHDPISFVLGKQKDKNIQVSVIYSKPLRFGGKAWN
jgi:hypothetical protein